MNISPILPEEDGLHHGEQDTAHVVARKVKKLAIMIIMAFKSSMGVNTMSAALNGWSERTNNLIV